METMATALRRYSDESGFGEDGGHASDWVDFKLGPLPFPRPNTEARKCGALPRSAPRLFVDRNATAGREHTRDDLSPLCWIVGGNVSEPLCG